MFKLFRKYNKLILVVGGCLLMVAFLVQGTLSQFMGGQGDYELGEIDGDPIRQSDRRIAGLQLELLGRIPMVRLMALGLVEDADDPPLQWTLMLHEAREMGLSASDEQVDGVLRQIGVDPADLERRAREQNTSADNTRVALHNWLILDQYRQLVTGQAFVPLDRRIDILNGVINTLRRGDFLRAQRMAEAIEGSKRLSTPLVELYLRQNRATLSGRAILIDADTSGESAAPPTEAQLQELFDAHRDDLPGEGEPHGFGYRDPDRVRVQYIEYPLERVGDAIEIEEDEVYAFWYQNKGRFLTDPNDPLSEPMAYSDVRDVIVDGMRMEKAAARADKMLKAAQGMLLEGIGAPSERDGYRDLTGRDPIPLDDVARRLKSEFGIEPTVHDYTREWTPVARLNRLPALGTATLVGRPEVTVEQYVASAREMEPGPDNALAPLHLQVGVPGLPMAAFDGSRVMLRLLDARPASSPGKLDDVRDRVEADYRRAAAYRRLMDEKTSWLSRATAEGLDDLARSTGALVTEIPTTPRRALSADGIVAPDLQGIGRSTALIDAMFDAAEVADAPVADAPAGQRLGVAGVDGRQSLVIFEILSYEPITRDQFERELRSPWLSPDVTALLLSTQIDPLAFDSISRRIGFKAAQPDEPDKAPEQDEQAATTADAGGGGSR